LFFKKDLSSHEKVDRTKPSDLSLLRKGPLLRSADLSGNKKVRSSRGTTGHPLRHAVTQTKKALLV